MKIRITKNHEGITAGTEGYTRTFNAEGECYAYFSNEMQGSGRWIPEGYYEVLE